jgi:hypothetical protein
MTYKVVMTIDTMGPGYPQFPAKSLALDPARLRVGSVAPLQVSSQFRSPSNASYRAHHMPFSPSGYGPLQAIRSDVAMWQALVRL